MAWKLAWKKNEDDGVHENDDVCIRGTYLEQVKEFTNLGFLQTQTKDGDFIREVEVRIAKASGV